MNLFRRLFFIASMSFILCSCNDIGEGIFGDWWPNDRNDASQVSKGSTFQILKERGNFSLFLSALEKTEYSGVVNGAGLVTVFAPTDDAFREFLNEKYGTSDIDLIAQNDPQGLELVVTFHLIKFQYSPDDFYAFSTSNTSPNPIPGDGSAYRYKTYARKPIESVMDPITAQRYTIYHKEEWLPVISSRLFTAKGSTNPEADYEKMFPDGTWAGSGDHLYVGDANVTEVGIQTDNGYLYVINKVARPLPTIYEELAAQREIGGESRLQNDYSLFALIVETLNSYVKDDDLTKLYAEPGEDIDLHWSMSKPGTDYSLPAIAGEWPYNDELGVDLMKSMTYGITAAIPNNEALSTWLREYFEDWYQPGDTEEDLISKLSYIHLYQIAASHLFDKRDLIIPSQLSAYGVTGVYGEHYPVPAGNVKEELFCTNGVIYGLDKVLVSPLFENSLVAPILQRPSTSTDSYNWYMTAFMERQYYRSVVGNDEYTLFIQDDQTLSGQYYNIMGGSVRGDKFVSDLTQNPANNIMNSQEKTTFLNNSLVAGILPTPEQIEEKLNTDSAYLRFYITRQSVRPLTFIVNYNGQYYTRNSRFGSESTDPQNVAVNILNQYSVRNGMTTYEIDRTFVPSNVSNIGPFFRRLVPTWKSQLDKLGITAGNAEWKDTWATEGKVTLDGKPYQKTYNSYQVIGFYLSDEAVTNGLANGYIPVYDPNDNSLSAREKLEAEWALRDYVNYYLIDKLSLGYLAFPLPGLLPEGAPTDQIYRRRMKTLVDYTNEANAKYLTIEWDPADPMVMTIEAMNGDRIQTTRKSYAGQRILPDVVQNNASFVIDECFNYKTMFGN